MKSDEEWAEQIHFAMQDAEEKDFDIKEIVKEIRQEYDRALRVSMWKYINDIPGEPETSDYAEAINEAKVKPEE